MARGDLESAAKSLDKALHCANVQPKVFLDRVDVELRSNRAAKAMEMLAVYLTAFPDDSRALLQRGLALERLGKPGEADLEFERAISLRVFALGVAYRGRAAARINLRDYPAAVDFANRALAEDGNDRDAFRLRGEALHRIKEYERAEADFTRCLELESDVPAFLNRAMVRLDAGNAQGAIDDCAALLRVDPKHTEGLLLRAKAYLRLGITHSAIRDTDAALQSDGGSLGAYELKAQILLSVDDFESAVDVFSKALQHRKSAHLYAQRGTCLSRLGKNEEALADYHKALQIDPNNWDATNGSGIVFRALGRFREALAYAEKAVAWKPFSQSALFNRGLIRRDLKDFTGSLRDFDRLLELKPKEPEVYNARGFTKQAMGDLVGAVEDYSLAIQLDPKFYLPYGNRSECHRKLGNGMKAIDDFDMASELQLHAKRRPVPWSN